MADTVPGEDHGRDPVSVGLVWFLLVVCQARRQARRGLSRVDEGKDLGDDDPIILACALSTVLDEPGHLQNRQVARDVRLLADIGADIANAVFTIL